MHSIRKLLPTFSLHCYIVIIVFCIRNDSNWSKMYWAQDLIIDKSCQWSIQLHTCRIFGFDFLLHANILFYEEKQKRNLMWNPQW